MVIKSWSIMNFSLKLKFFPLRVMRRYVAVSPYKAVALISYRYYTAVVSPWSRYRTTVVSRRIIARCRIAVTSHHCIVLLHDRKDAFTLIESPRLYCHLTRAERVKFHSLGYSAHDRNDASTTSRRRDRALIRSTTRRGQGKRCS